MKGLLLTIQGIAIALLRHIQGAPDAGPWLNITFTPTGRAIQAMLETRCPVFWRFGDGTIHWWCRVEEGIECSTTMKLRVRRRTLDK